MDKTVDEAQEPENKVPFGFIAAVCNIVWVILLVSGYRGPLLIVPCILGAVIGGASLLGSLARERDAKK